MSTKKKKVKFVPNLQIHFDKFVNTNANKSNNQLLYGLSFEKSLANGPTIKSPLFNKGPIKHTNSFRKFPTEWELYSMQLYIGHKKGIPRVLQVGTEHRDNR